MSPFDILFPNFTSRRWQIYHEDAQLRVCALQEDREPRIRLRKGSTG